MQNEKCIRVGQIAGLGWTKSDPENEKVDQFQT